MRSQSGTNPASDTVKAPIKTTSSNQGAPRSRTDSEKENTPVDNVNISREKSNVNQGVKVERSEVVKVESQEKVTKTTTENQLPKEKLNIQDLDPAIVAICIGKSVISCSKYKRNLGPISWLCLLPNFVCYDHHFLLIGKAMNFCASCVSKEGLVMWKMRVHKQKFRAK